MNMDDVEREFWGDQREQPTRVRLARVVRALRDEMCGVQADDERSPITLDMHQLWQEFQAILGGDAEGAAGASARKDEEAATHGQSTPAAAPVRVIDAIAGTVLRMEQSDGSDPMQRILDQQRATAMERFPLSSDVCEWRPKGIFHGARVHAAACDGRVHATHGLSHCPTCKRPISFKDAVP